MEKEKNGPVQKFKAGAVSASVWGNETLKDKQVVSFNTITLERVYMDKASGSWKYTNSLRTTDLPRAALVLNKAFEFLVLNNNNAEQEA